MMLLMAPYLPRKGRLWMPAHAPNTLYSWAPQLRTNKPTLQSVVQSVEPMIQHSNKAKQALAVQLSGVLETNLPPLHISSSQKLDFSYLRPHRPTLAPT